MPYLAKFYLYARRHSSEEVAVRALCLTEPDRAEHPLELQEDFQVWWDDLSCVWTFPIARTNLGGGGAFYKLHFESPPSSLSFPNRYNVDKLV